MDRNSHFTFQFKKLIDFLHKNCHKAPSSRTVKEINQYFQKHYLRGPDKERWEMDLKAFENHRKELMPIFIDLEFVHEIKPKNKKYDKVLILGASAPRMYKRMDYFKNSKVSTDKIYVLTGKRPLNPDIDQFDGYNTCKDEAMAARWLVKNCFQFENCEFVEVDMIENKETRKKRRPNTYDTIEKFVKENQDINSNTKILVISNQPYIKYQEACVKKAFSTMGKNIKFETVGEKAEDDESIAIYLDTLARLIYTIT